MKNVHKILITGVLAIVVAVIIVMKSSQDEQGMKESTSQEQVHSDIQNLPRLLDLGAGKCIPCKMMAPILDALKEEYKGQFEVIFIDVWENPDAATPYNIKLIPTQIFFDKNGKELFRHEGFFSKEDILAKWKELGISLKAPANAGNAFSRWEPAEPDKRLKDDICYLCDGTIDPNTRTVMKTKEGDVAFCSPHCYIITYASLTNEDKTHTHTEVRDGSGKRFVPVTSAVYLYGLDENNRSTIKAFPDREAARKELANSGGNILTWTQLLEKETASICAFCDRPVYAEDACVVHVDGIQTWGCCPMCALGVAARTGKDIEIIAKDALTSETVRVKTYQGHVSELEPATAIAWGGARKDDSGKIVSTGCFKQAFFTNEENLRKWVAEHPLATGRMISIEQALQAKIKLTPEQISKACKIGECSPK